MSIDTRGRTTGTGARGTSWWPDVNEATFQARQDVGLAVLIAIAAHAARF